MLCRNRPSSESIDRNYQNAVMENDLRCAVHPGARMSPGFSRSSSTTTSRGDCEWSWEFLHSPTGRALVRVSIAESDELETSFNAAEFGPRSANHVGDWTGAEPVARH